MYYIQNKLQVDWTFVFRDHMMKGKRVIDFKFTYVVLISNFLEYFEVDLDDELQVEVSIWPSPQGLALTHVG